MYDLKYPNIMSVNLLIVLIFPSFVLGPLIPDIIVSFSAVFFLYYSIKNKNYFYFNNKFLIFFIIFCIYCTLISIFVAEDILLSLKSSVFFFRIGIFSCFIWYLIDKDKIILNYFYYSLLICFLALVLDGYYQYFNGKNILGFELQGTRVSSLFGDELIMGSYLSRLFPLLFALFLIKKKKKFEIYFLGLLFILIDLLIYMSGERTAFFFLNLSTVFIIILIKKYQIFRLVTFVIAIFCIVIVSHNSSNLTERMFLKPAKDMGIIKTSEIRTIFTPIHDSHLRTAFSMFKDRIILGHGPKMFRVKCSNPKYANGINPCSTHPHNFYAQLLAETGIIGFGFLLSGFCYVLYCAFRQFKSILLREKRYLTDYQVCLLAGILIGVWPFSPNGNFFNNWLAIVYILPLGFYLQSIYSKK
jgi:O-antigen ligase